MSSTAQPRAVCGECLREVATSIPARGDGSMSVYRRHAVIKGGRVICAGSRQDVPAHRYVR